MPIQKFKQWLAESTPAEKRELAIKASTSVSTLWQISYEVRGNGKPFNASSELAGRIERAITSINKRRRHAPLPEVRKGDISKDCAKCRFYKECE
jgi:hypothetical protein